MVIRFWGSKFLMNKLAVALTAASLFLIACNSRVDTSVVLPKSTVAVWHLVPNADSVLVSIGGTQIKNTIYGVKLPDTVFTGGLVPMVVKVNNDTIFKGNTTTIPGTAYTLVVGDSAARAQFFLYQNRRIDTVGNRAGLRIIHAAPMVGISNVTWRDSISVFTTRSSFDFFRSPNLFFTYNYTTTGTGELALKPANSVAATDSITTQFIEGKNYTMLVLNRATPPRIFVLPD